MLTFLRLCTNLQLWWPCNLHITFSHNLPHTSEWNWLINIDLPVVAVLWAQQCLQ